MIVKAQGWLGIGSRSLLPILLWTASLFAVIAVFIGFYYEEFTDVVFQVMFSGIFSGRPDHLFNTYGSHYLLSHVYKALYLIAPSIPWYGVILSGFMFLATLNLLVLLRRILASHTIWGIAARGDASSL